MKVLFQRSDLKAYAKVLGGKRISHLYFIGAENFDDNKYKYFVKIGVADEPIARLKQLQCGNPLALEIDTLVPCIDPYSVESSLHTLLQPIHLRGEWYLCKKASDFDLLNAARTLLEGMFEITNNAVKEERTKRIHEAQD